VDHYYVTDPAGADLFGHPPPAPGVRVTFDPDRLAAYGLRHQLPMMHRAPKRQGLAVVEIVVDAEAWPCRLWRVGDLEEPQPLAYYLRCRSFVVREELPSWMVLGPRGEQVAAVLARAGRLTQQDVLTVAAEPDDEEKAARSAVFNRWRVRRDAGDRSVGSVCAGGGARPAAWAAVEAAARSHDPGMFGWAEEALDEPILTDPAWQQARQAAVAATLALVMPDDLITPDEAAVLSRRWQLLT
jgi:hypothetical protein